MKVLYSVELGDSVCLEKTLNLQFKDMHTTLTILCKILLF